MSHAHIALLDSAIRSYWYGMGLFGLSKALNVSAKQPKGIKRPGKRVAPAVLRDSSTPRNDTARQREWWDGPCKRVYGE